MLVSDSEKVVSKKIMARTNTDAQGYFILGRPGIRPCTAAQVAVGNNKDNQVIKPDNRTLIEQWHYRFDRADVIAF